MNESLNQNISISVMTTISGREVMRDFYIAHIISKYSIDGYSTALHLIDGSTVTVRQTPGEIDAKIALAKRDESSPHMFRELDAVSRVEIITDKGREFTIHDQDRVISELQDDGRTLKIFTFEGDK